MLSSMVRLASISLYIAIADYVAVEIQKEGNLNS